MMSLSRLTLNLKWYANGLHHNCQDLWKDYLELFFICLLLYNLSYLLNYHIFLLEIAIIKIDII